MKTEQQELDGSSALAREQREERDAAADKAAETRRDALSSSEKDAEIERLKARLAEQEVEYQRKRAAWVDGNFKDFREDHPFNILVQTGQEPVDMLPVKVCVNGDWWTIERGKWVRVPGKVVHALKNAEVNAIQQMVSPDGNTYNALILRNRHPYSVLPLECVKQYEGKCACEPVEKTIERQKLERAQEKLAKRAAAIAA